MALLALRCVVGFFLFLFSDDDVFAIWMDEDMTLMKRSMNDLCFAL